MRVRATESFVGESRDELSFQKGDIIVVLESDKRLEPGWLRGICRDAVGIFPKVFALPLPDKIVREVNNPAFTTKQYRGLSPEELSFGEGELIFVTRELEHGWSQGYIGNETRKGIFPSSHVQIIEDKPIPPDSPQPLRSSQNMAARTPSEHKILREYAGALRSNVVGDSLGNLSPSNQPVSHNPLASQGSQGSLSYQSQVSSVPKTRSIPGLPAGWELSYLDDGTAFYIDHNTRTTSWVPPIWSQTRSITGSAPIQPHQMRPGWEQLVDSNGNLFFVDHNTRTTHWNYPLS
mmetsp:Transcript_19198/g.24251  ORF Transcript_19198/g.24251 Transcript_19198/m.24251 type:complete len:292 (-) Transcript_19198:25-900(-)